MNEQFPVLPFRSTLYTPEELFRGFRTAEPTSYADTPDFAAYRSTRLGPNREVGMLRALHDQCITEARDEFVAGRRVVAIMGGHQMTRTDPAYRLVAEMAARLTGRGDVVVSGGGPGAMEAAHLGALVSSSGPEALAAALDHLAVAPNFPHGAGRLLDANGAINQPLLAELHAWQRPAFEVVAGLAEADRGESMAVPTWFYGHEPPTPFATHLAKYFSNSLREDGLLAVAADGIIFAPGRAGTLQEIFQEAAQNAYRVFHDRFSPMAFLDTDACWSKKFPIGPLLETLFGPEDFGRYVQITADPEEILSFLRP